LLYGWTFIIIKNRIEVSYPTILNTYGEKGEYFGEKDDLSEVVYNFQENDELKYYGETYNGEGEKFGEMGEYRSISAGDI
jgi:hypothetical protein